MTRTDLHAHVRQCVQYGVTPLTEHEFARMQAQELYSIEAAFSVASDLDAGFSFTDAVNAYKATQK